MLSSVLLAIVGIVVGAVVLLFGVGLILFLVLYIRKKKTKSSRVKQKQQDIDSERAKSLTLSEVLTTVVSDTTTN
jgi:uncharacterized membrane protein